ncbi:KxYKxGKxW signal peptide domain-containing protein [Leuconostoc citreum]|uniref:KxYKxGKxW signal peptide domain-containing protein n=1 Tax=Leuconostoc citreum TaxID=33964 RepID=UPI00200A2298|nr:KxYKxGKxW signal peptide domain-containing protein [Leuconostoc citreum]MCK8605636.1 KxYKxGKxW signal peptide domain-containing protein [Leuconostoc citreum]
MPSKKYKLYKDGKRLVIGAIAVTGIMAVTMVKQVSADTMPTSDTSVVKTTVTKTVHKQVQLQTVKQAETQPKTVPTEQVKSDVPTRVPNGTTQDKAKETVDKAQDTVKSSADTATKSGVKVTQNPTKEVTIDNGNVVDKSSEILNDLNKQDQALKQATATQKANEQAKVTADKQYDEAVKKGQSDLNKTYEELDKSGINAEKHGIEISMAVSKLSPKYQDIKVLVGNALLKAMAHNISVYQREINSAVSKGQADKKTLDELTAEYDYQVLITNKGNLERDTAVSKGQSDLAHANAELQEQLDIAKKLGVNVSTKYTDKTPTYVDTKGLVGQKKLEAIRANIALYVGAIKSGTDYLGATTYKLKQELVAYQKALADFKAGIATNTGVKWTKNTTVTAGNGAQKMNGNEVVVDFGDGTIKTAAMYATQGNFLNQNTDANFDNIFKINGSGSVVVRNTTNGNVTITFSNISAPANIGTYVAIYGNDNGGLAWSVFALYNGHAVSGAGESGGGSASIASGHILDYIYSYDGTIEADGNLSVVTLNDIDNNQSVTVNGINGKVTTGRNVHQNGNTFSANGGDVSQGSSGQLSSNGVRWELTDTGHVKFSFHHATSDRQDTSIVGGAFGADSQIPKAPKPPVLIAEKVSVTSPSQLEMPEVPKAKVQKVTIALPPKAEAPKPQEVSYGLVNVKTTPPAPTPVPTSQPVQASILPHTGINEHGKGSMVGILSSIARLGLLGVMTKFKKQK